jgi:hypothetical protein
MHSHIRTLQRAHACCYETLMAIGTEIGAPTCGTTFTTIVGVPGAA